MQSNLILQVSCLNKVKAQEIDFFSCEGWSMDNESLFINKIQELFKTLRNVTPKFEFTINIEVSDMDMTLFLINKCKKKELEVNNVKLSLREIEVLGLLMQGLTNQEIADKLFINFETVRSHRKHILEKTGAKNTASLINYYHQTFFDK
jgi:DNA-binding CsgD family transcriptional regulator